MEFGNQAEAQAFEIASALFRFSKYIKEESIAKTVKAGAMSLLEAASRRSREGVQEATRTIRYAIGIGVMLGIVLPDDERTLEKALERCRDAISEDRQTGKSFEMLLKESSVKGITSSTNKGEPSRVEKKDLPVATVAKAPIQLSENKNTSASEPLPNASLRKEQLLQKIRQSGNAKLRDLQAEFPDVSERTLRYDLQSLAEEGAIERVGSSGPATFYRMPQIATVTTQPTPTL